MGCCNGKNNITGIKIPIETRPPYQALSLKYEFDVPPDAGVWTTGLAKTDKNQLVLCFRNQFKLLIFDVDGEFKQSCEMANRPYNAAIIPDSSQLLVTLQGNTSLQYVDTVTWTAGKHISPVC